MEEEQNNLPNLVNWSKNQKPKRLGLWLGILAAFLILFGLGLIFYRPVLVIGGALQDAIISVDKTQVYPPTRLSPGRRTIAVTKPGYVPYQFSGKIAPFVKFNLSITLRPLPSPKVIVSDQAFSLNFSPKDKKIFYLAKSRQAIYQLAFLPSQTNSEQKIERSPITPDNLPPLKTIVFSPDYQLAMFSRQDGDTGLYDFKKYDLLNQEYQSWGKDIGSLVWSPDGKQIAYYFAPPDDKALIISDRSHQKVERAFDLRSAGVNVSASDPQTPRLAWSPDGKLILIVAQGKLFLMDASTKTLTELSEKNITEAVFSPDSRHLLYTRQGKLEYLQIELVNSLSGKTEDQENVGKIKVGDPILINLSASAPKTAFSQNQDELVVLGSDGKVYRVNLISAALKPYFSAKTLTQVKDIALSSDEKILYALTSDKLIALTLDDGKY